jgi:glutathione S-transferase
MLVLYGTPTARATRITWALEEADAEYEYRFVDLGRGEGRSADYLAVNPTGKVPTLVDAEMVITESLAICYHLGERFPQARLIPEPGTAERARFHRWAAFAVCELEQPLWTIAKHTFALPEKLRVPAIIDTARWEFEQAARVVATRVAESEHLAGAPFSAADILTAPTLGWARKALGGLPIEALDAYADRVRSRPALARALQREKAARDTG